MPGRLYSFGPFRVDVAKRLFLRDGTPVPLPAKAFDLLVLLVERRGQVVDKEEILTNIWRGAIVEENNLARSISTLRKALDDAHGEHRYIITVPGRGYEFVADVDPSDAIPERHDRPAPRRRRAFAAAVVALAAVGAGVYLARQGEDRPEPSVASQLWQLTFAEGWQGEPVWSPDGRMVAFTSNRSGNMDIWVQALDSGGPLQVTASPAHDTQPDWSRDGRLVYRSDREGGGLYLLPALGGQERQLSTFGYHPRWSPDGTRVLFQRSNFQGRVATAREVYTVGLDGQPPRRVLDELFAQFATFTAAWHPDSKRISIWGSHLTDGPSFWTAPLDGGRPVKSQLADEVRAGFGEGTLRFIDGDNAPLPFTWSRSGDTLYFEGVSRGVRNVWRIDVDPSTLQWTGGPERLTTSADLSEGVSLSPDGTKLALAVRKERTRLWSLPLDAASGKLLGPGDAITTNTVDALTPVLSRDGEKLLFAAERGGAQEIWERTLADGGERMIVPGDKYRRVSPMYSHDNRRVMYLRTLGPDVVTATREVVTIPASGGPEQALRTAAPVARLFDWSSDGSWILAALQEKSARGYELAFVRADGTGPADVRVLATDPATNLFKARLSTDQRWVAYVAPTGPGASAIYLVPAAGGAPVALTSGDSFDDRPRWSPDGRVVYFLSSRSGFLNVWGRRFDADRGLAAGDAFPVTRFDSPAQMVPPRMIQLGVAIASDRLIVPVSEGSGNVWILDGVDQ
ncbi:MAG: hypothetical protein FJW14_09380 [Acidimicrobiia bacterium]|nr:hypothetical protein [Acidimicrobiia bacterium]